MIMVDEGYVATKWPHAHFTYRNGEGEYKPYTLSLYHCFTSNFDGENNAVMVDKLMRHAWHWFMAYMK